MIKDKYIHHLLYIAFKNGVNSTLAARKINNNLVGEANVRISERQARACFQQFREGRTSTERKPGSGRPPAAVNKRVLAQRLRRHPDATCAELAEGHCSKHVAKRWLQATAGRHDRKPRSGHRLTDDTQKQQRLIGHFDSAHRSTGISSFLGLDHIFGNDSEYMDKESGEVAIEVEFRVKTQYRAAKREVSLSKPHHQQPRLAYVEQAGNDAEKENQMNGAKDGGSELRRNGDDPKNQKKRKIKSPNGSEELRDRSEGDADEQKFPCRRSCRISPKFLDNLRRELLREKVGRAVHEPFLQIIHCPIKGRGLRTKIAFNKDDFVVEYKGQVIDLRLARKRERRYARNVHIGCYMFYFRYKERRYCIDATAETRDKGRLVNHSRLAPNLRAKVFDLGNKYPHLCLVALRQIAPGEELRFDYGDRTPLTVEKHPWLLNS